MAQAAAREVHGIAKGLGDSNLDVCKKGIEQLIDGVVVPAAKLADSACPVVRALCVPYPGIDDTGLYG